MADLKKKKKKKKISSKRSVREETQKKGNQDGLRRKRNQGLSILSSSFLLCFLFLVEMFGDFVKKE
ncbi:hypothetical protein Bca101_019489 [Brassica carinata]